MGTSDAGDQIEGLDQAKPKGKGPVGYKQSPEHIQKRIEAVRRKREAGEIKKEYRQTKEHRKNMQRMQRARWDSGIYDNRKPRSK